MGIFCKQHLSAIQIQKRLLYPALAAGNSGFFLFMWHDVTLLFDCTYFSTNSGSHRRISKEEAEKNVTQNTTRFKFCGTTSLTCPDQCKGIFLLHGRWVRGHFLFIVRPSLSPLCVALLLLLLSLLSVVGKPVSAMSYFRFLFLSFLLGFWLWMSLRRQVKFPSLHIVYPTGYIFCKISITVYLWHSLEGSKAAKYRHYFVI